MKYILLPESKIDTLIENIKNALIYQKEGVFYDSINRFFIEEKFKVIDSLETKTINQLKYGEVFLPKENVCPVINEEGLIIGFFVLPLNF